MAKLLYVVILNFNHIEDLKETIDSFDRQDYANFKILVVDNKSTDSSLEWLANTHPNITIIANDENLGWAGGNNIGIKYALKMKAEYVLLANNDIYFNNPRILSSLVERLDGIEWLKTLGPKQNYYSQKNLTYNSGWNFFPKTGLVFNRNRQNISSPYENIEIVDNVAGSFMLIKAELINAIGLIDEKFFLYAEDADYCIRAWKIGFASGVCKDLTIYHKVSSTSGNNSPLKIYYKTRNIIYLAGKHKDYFSFYNKFIFCIFKNHLKLFYSILIKKEYSKNRIRSLKAHFLGIIDGLILKRFGKTSTI